MTVIKILLIPSLYRSTDFDVHRNWLSITHHLPLSQWYFDTGPPGPGPGPGPIHGSASASASPTTVHTLDYPPSFAFFQYLLSNNFITKYLIQQGYLEEQCLALLGDHENEVGVDCVIFQRGTVILADCIFFMGAFLLSWSILWNCNDDGNGNGNGNGDGDGNGNGNGDGDGDGDGDGNGNGNGDNKIKSNNNNKDTIDKKKKNGAQKKILSIRISCFLLIVSNSGLILLDHIHFQYNGMLLGVLMASIACILHAIAITGTGTGTSIGNDNVTTPAMQVMQAKRVTKMELLASILFTLLLTLKHLYLTLAPVYFFYLLRKFCLVVPTRRTIIIIQKQQQQQQYKEIVSKFHFQRLVLLGSTVAITLSLPFLPFGIQHNPKEQMIQMLSRLFPFQRGLCHDYWAGNIWALYSFASKVVSFLSRLRQEHEDKDEDNYKLSFFPSSLPEITPLCSATSLLLALIPSMICAWRAASPSLLYAHAPKKRQMAFLTCIVYSSLTSFMLAYHVHEKAIMTAIIPMTVLAFWNKECARLFLRLMAVGQFGLMPLLYQSTEFGVKVCLQGSFLWLSVWILECVHLGKAGENEEDEQEREEDEEDWLIQGWDRMGLGIMVCLLVYTEWFHTIIFGEGVWEFLPLMMISLFCAVGLVYCWVHCGIIMMRAVVS